MENVVFVLTLVVGILQVIPRQLCVGFDASVLQELRKQHSKSEGVYSGVNSTTGKVLDFVSFEPADAKIKEIQSATESACKCLDEA